MEITGKNKNQYTWLKNNYAFRFNVVTGMYEYRPLKKGKPIVTETWQEFSDRVKNDISLTMDINDFAIADNKLTTYIESTIVSKDFDPILDYFENLNTHDQKGKSYISELAKTIECDNPRFFELAFKKFLVSTVSCLLEPDAVNDTCLVFRSPQGEGKSRWMRKLLPQKFRTRFLKEGFINPKNKDHTIFLAQYWFIHLDELESLKGANVGDIKSFITTQRISERKSYGRYNSHFVRRASFLGSVNEAKFLTDITGNRRWLVFEVSKIDYQHNIYIDAVWAEAYKLYCDGFKHWFDKKEIEELNNLNESFREMSLEEELLLKLYTFPKTEDGTGQWLSTTDLMVQMLGSQGNIATKLNNNILGRALSRYCHLKKKSGVNRYYLHVISENDDNDDKDDLPF